MRTLTLTLIALLFLTACDKVRPPQTLERDGIRLTRTEIDFALMAPALSQVPGTTMALGRDGWDFGNQPMKLFVIRLQDGKFERITEWTTPTNLSRTLIAPDKSIYIKRSLQSKSWYGEGLVFLRADGESEFTPLPKDQVNSLSTLVHYKSGTFVIRKEQRSGPLIVSFIPLGSADIKSQSFSNVTALLYGFESDTLTVKLVLSDGSVHKLDAAGSTTIKSSLPVSAVDWLKTASRPGGHIGVDGAFAGDLIAARTSKGIEVFNGEKIVTLETWDAFMTRPSGKPRSERMANYLVEHPEDLAAEGRPLRLDVHNASARVRPLDEDTLAIFDHTYNRSVLLELAQ